jgi:hypothetical protein
LGLRVFPFAFLVPSSAPSHFIGISGSFHQESWKHQKQKKGESQANGGDDEMWM